MTAGFRGRGRAGAGQGQGQGRAGAKQGEAGQGRSRGEAGAIMPAHRREKALQLQGFNELFNRGSRQFLNIIAA